MTTYRSPSRNQRTEPLGRRTVRSSIKTSRGGPALSGGASTENCGYDIFGPSYAQEVADLAGAPLLARMPIDPNLVRLARNGRVEEIDDPIVDVLAAGVENVMAARPEPAGTISLL